MEGLWTPNSESDADRNAPLLAKVSVAAGMYVWLHSRVYATGNAIKISEGALAEILGVSRRQVLRAIDRLVEQGLIEHEGKKGNGGGSVFHLLGVANETHTTCSRREDYDRSVAINESNPPHKNDSNASIEARLRRRERRMTKIG